MNKKDFASAMAKNSSFTQTQCLDMLQVFIDTATEVVLSDEDIIFKNFGAFRNSIRKTRVGRNPRTGEEVTIPAHTAVTFRASKKLIRKL